MKIRRNVCSALLVGSILGALAGCASGDSRPDDKMASPMTPKQHASSANTAETQEYKAIQNAYSDGEYEAALNQLGVFERKHPHSVQLPYAENLYGLIYLALKTPVAAITHFKRASQLSKGTPAIREYVLFNLATAQYESGQFSDAYLTTQQISATTLNPENRLKFHFLRARIYRQQGLQLEATRECLTASRLFGDLKMQGSFATILSDSLPGIGSAAALDQLYSEFENSPLIDHVLYRLGVLETSSNDPATEQKGMAHLKLLMARFPLSTHFSESAGIVQNSATDTAPVAPTIAVSESVAALTSPSPSPSAPQVADSASVSTAPSDPNTVGILLPMKGKFAKFGARTLQGIELAFKIFNVNEPDSKITLAIEDSGTEPDQAVKALDRLVQKHHVVAVLGPLLSKGIDQVTQRARELGVPMISLARSTGVQSEYLFQGGLTMQMQSKELARYAVQHEGLKHLAVMYPKDKVGEEFSQHFWDAVEASGGKVVGIESYSPNDTDFRVPVDKLSGLYYTEARQAEIDALAKAREVNHIKKHTRKTEEYYSLKPIVDYQAVFIPDEAKLSSQILPTFAYRDVDHVRFLGTSAWNSPELPARAQSYAEGAVFVDGFFADSQTPVVREFVDKYKATFGDDPSEMEALAYDAARVLDWTLTGLGASADRTSVRARLAETRNFPGVTGRITYQDGSFDRALKVLTVSKGHIIEMSGDAETPRPRDSTADAQ